MQTVAADNDLALFLERGWGAVDRFAEAEKTSISRSVAIFTELYKFLSLCAEGQEPLAPSQVVDDAWHLTLGDEATYVSLCAAVGRKIEHIPHEQPMPVAYRRCLGAMQRRFGPLDSTIWGSDSAARCVGAG
ncbi:MAG TPA: hypothetical protein VNC15_07540 [Solirubrobacterales bacterium]|jgi:hypothetical protein|nr:hypothetical protein [Solirubrobacterales bacterium]